ncbi:hypothetical protein CPLU01_13324 [Colletotrichum plurivorum]|uniref:Uncharacterized protein n=1 Tax=Colletotrichum plurivorum TaxID=2175906 RepID=A0A8H6JS76_9PEZI|nr:hypothetical protein CPLU01_13324 [Colletotrichum plurivorum]
MAVWDRQLRDVDMEKDATDRQQRIQGVSLDPTAAAPQTEQRRAHGANGTSIAHYPPTRYDTRRELNRENGPRACSRLAGVGMLGKPKPL